MDSAPEVVRHSMHGKEAVPAALEVVPPNSIYGPQKPLESLPRESRICGLRSITFWLVSALSILLVALIGMGVGLGVGLGRVQQRDAQSPTTTTVTAPAPASAAQTTSPSSSTSAVTSTISGKTPVASASPSTPCPAGNGTILAPSLGSVQYRLMCDSDFSGSAKLTLSSVVVSSFDDCLDLCNTMNYFQSRTDVGCTYNVAGTGTQTPGTCWCLGGEGKTVVVNVGNDAAVPLG